MPGRDPPHPGPRTGHRGGSDHPSSPSPPAGISLSVPIPVAIPVPVPVPIPAPAAAAAHPPLRRHHHCITPAGTAAAPPGRETQAPEPLPHTPSCSSRQPKGSLSIPLAAAEEELLPTQGARSDSALANTLPQRGGGHMRNCLSGVPCFHPTRF